MEIDLRLTEESWEKMGRREGKKTEVHSTPTFKNVNGWFIILGISVTESRGATPEYVKSRAVYYSA